MTPIIAVFMSMISLLALVADRASLQEQGEVIPLPSVDDGVSRNFLDVAKRTLPLKMTPTRNINLRRVPRSAPGSSPRHSPDVAAGAPEGFKLSDDNAILLQSLIIRALSKRDIRDQLWGGRSSTGTSAPTKKPRLPRPTPHRPNSLGHLGYDLMVHGRDRDQLRMRWKIANSRNRVANIHG